MTRILVYGTLRRGERAHGALGKTSKFVEQVRVPGFDMFKLWGFPGVKHNPDNKEGIVGEVFKVSRDTLQLLDNYEGYYPDKPERSAYVRKTIDVNGEATDLYVYNIERNPYYGEHGAIPGGDWKEREREF